MRPINDPGLPWCGVRIPTSCAASHFFLAGKSGSGKSSLIFPLLEEVLCRVRPGSGQRVLILDTKMNLVPYLYEAKLKVPVHILHPGDRRGVSVNLCRACKTPDTAAQWASNLICDEENGQNRFFADAPRSLVRASITNFLLNSPDSWTLRDLILAMSDAEDLKCLLKRNRATKKALAVLGSHETALNVLASLMTHQCKYESVAAAWSTAEHQICLDDWLRGESVLLLGMDQRRSVALGHIYGVIIRHLSELILSLPESPTVHTWIFLDEVRHGGRLFVDSLRALATNARSKGVSLILGFQDKEGMEQAFGEREARELIGQCGNIALLKLMNPNSTEWASQVLGDTEWLETTRSFGKQGAGTSEHIVVRRAVLPSEFADLPEAGPRNGIPGWFAAEGIGAWRGPVPWSEVVRALPSRNSHIPAFLPRPDSAEFLKEWSDEERARLGLPPAKRDGKKQRNQVVGKGRPNV